MSGGEPRATLNSGDMTDIILMVLGFGLMFGAVALWLFWYWGLIT